MSEWKTLTIREFAEVISGSTPATNVPEYWDGGIEWVTPVDLSKLNTRFLKSTIRKISKNGLGNSSTGLIPAYNVVMSSRAPIGYFAIPVKDFTTNQGCKSFKLFPQQDAEYHYYSFLLNINYFKRFGSGSTFAEISKNDIEKLSFTFPTSLAEQRKIAHILSTVDAVIEKTEAAIAKYKAIKAGMMRDLFTRGIDLKTGKLRPSYDEAPELYKESELGWVPKEWDSCAMGNYILDNLYGPRFDAKDYSENGNVKTIRGTDFTKDGYILYEQAPKASLPAPLISTHKLRDGDVIIVTTAECGLTAVFEKPNVDIDFIPSAYSVKYRFRECVKPYFIKFYMETDVAIRQVKKYVRQGTLGNLPGSDVLRFAMIFPKIGEQNEIARRLLTINANIKNEEVVLSKNKQLKSALMSDLLTGKVRVKYEEEKAEAV